MAIAAHPYASLLTPEGRPRDTRRWRELRARFIRREIRRYGQIACAECGIILDPKAEPGTRWAVDVDHVHPIAAGGHPFPPLDGLRALCVTHNRGAGRAIALAKAHRENADLSTPTSPHGATDAEGRWNATTRAW